MKIDEVRKLLDGIAYGDHTAHSRYYPDKKPGKIADAIEAIMPLVDGEDDSEKWAGYGQNGTYSRYGDIYALYDDAKVVSACHYDGIAAKSVTLEEAKEAVIMALWSDISADDEAAEIINMDSRTDRDLAILTDNIYCRLVDSDVPNYVKAEMFLTRDMLPMLPVSTVENLNVDDVYIGSKPEINTAAIKHKNTLDLSKYRLEREWTETEKRLIPKNIIVDDDVHTVTCEVLESLHHTQKTNLPANTILLYGPPGTGKSQIVKQLGEIRQQPVVEWIGSGDSDTYSAMAELAPYVVNTDYSDFDAQSAWLDPEGEYEAITGKDGTGRSFQDCAEAYFEIKAAKQKNSTAYQMNYSAITQAIRYGYIVEIQEANMPKADVFSVLNKAMETINPYVVMPITNEIVPRHPDCVIIYTINPDAIGTKEMNQAVKSRAAEHYAVLDLTDKEMVERAIAMTGEKDRRKVERMAKIYCLIREKARDAGYGDGVDFRGFANWVNLSKYQDPYQKCITTVINKITHTDEDFKKEIIDKVLNVSPFATSVVGNGKKN